MCLQEAGTADASGAFEYTPVVDWVRAARFCMYFYLFVLFVVCPLSVVFLVYLVLFCVNRFHLFWHFGILTFSYNNICK